MAGPLQLDADAGGDRGMMDRRGRELRHCQLLAPDRSKAGTLAENKPSTIADPR